MAEAMVALAGLGFVFTLVWWLIGAIIIAVLASERGRSGFGYFVMGVFFSPFFSAMALIAAPNRAVLEAEKAERRHAVEQFKIGIDGLWKQLDVIRQNTVPRDLPVFGTRPAPEAPAMATPADNGFHFCPGCRKLRHVSVTRCVYCGSAEPTVSELPVPG